MTTIVHILATAVFAYAVAVILYWLMRWRQRQLGKECAIIFAVFGSGLISVAAIKTNSPPARAIGHVLTSLCTNAFNAIEQQTGYSFSDARTNETHDLTMPNNAQLAERIARRGSYQDGFYLFDSFTNRLAREGLDIEHPVWVQTDGTVTVRSPSPGIPIEELSLYTTYSNITVYAPLQGAYGFLPGSRWPEFNISRIWTAVTDRGTRVITWEGALRHRDTTQPVSFQAEFKSNGDIEYHYNPAQTNFAGIGLYRGGAAMSFDRSTVEPFNRLGDEPSTNVPFTFHFPLSTLHLSYVGDLGNGIPDGTTPEAWSNNVLRATAETANFSVTLLEAVSASAANSRIVYVVTDEDYEQHTYSRKIVAANAVMYPDFDADGTYTAADTAFAQAHGLGPGCWPLPPRTSPFKIRVTYEIPTDCSLRAYLTGNAPARVSFGVILLELIEADGYNHYLSSQCFSTAESVIERERYLTATNNPGRVRIRLWPSLYNVVADWTLSPSVDGGARLFSSETGGLELYFVRSFDSPIAGFNQRNAQGEITGIILPPDVTFITLAHEIGHSCGLADIYINDSMYEHHYTERLTPVSGPISYSRLPNDWGCTSQDVHFYYLNVDQQDLISHLLMHGHSSQFKADIPSGNIYGIWYSDSGDGDSAVSSRAPVSFGSLTSRNPVHK